MKKNTRGHNRHTPQTHRLLTGSQTDTGQSVIHPVSTDAQTHRRTDASIHPQFPFQAASSTHACTVMAGLKTLNPSCAVLTITPGMCGWWWISLMFSWPWWMKSSCGG